MLTVRLNASDASTAAPGDPTVRERTRSRLAEVLDRPPGVELTTSCTHALEAAAVVLGIGPGDEVIVPAFTFPSTANAFLLRGARVRFADVRPDTANLDPVGVKDRITDRTRVIVPVHYAGVAADPVAITTLAADADCDVVEDAAHGLFGSFDGTPLGRLGRLGCLSFHRTKNLSTVEGGALVVNDPELLDAVEVVVDKGTNRGSFDRGEVAAYEWTGVGSGWRMPDPSVRLLGDQLDRAGAIQDRRRLVWDRYATDLAPWADRVGATLPTVPAGVRHPAHLFWIALPDALPRTRFVAHCASAGVEVAQHYGSLPDSRFGRTIRHPDDVCPVASDLAGRLVRLPIHHELSDADVDRVLEAVLSSPG